MHFCAIFRADKGYPTAKPCVSMKNMFWFRAVQPLNAQEPHQVDWLENQSVHGNSGMYCTSRNISLEALKQLHEAYIEHGCSIYRHD